MRGSEGMWREDDRGEGDGHKQSRISQDSPTCKQLSTQPSRFLRTPPKINRC